MRLTTALVSLALLAGTSPLAAADRPVFKGQWVGNCAGAVRCLADFKPVGDGYDMSFRVTAIGDATKVVCSVDVHLGKVDFDVLTASVGAREYDAVYLPTMEVVLSGLPKAECGGADVNSRYVPYGDI